MVARARERRVAVGRGDSGVVPLLLPADARRLDLVVRVEEVPDIIAERSWEVAVLAVFGLDGDLALVHDHGAHRAVVDLDP